MVSSFSHGLLAPITLLALHVPFRSHDSHRLFRFVTMSTFWLSSITFERMRFRGTICILASVDASVVTASFVTASFVTASFVTASFVTASVVTASFVKASFVTASGGASFVTASFVTASFVTASGGASQVTAIKAVFSRAVGTAINAVGTAIVLATEDTFSVLIVNLFEIIVIVNLFKIMVIVNVFKIKVIKDEREGGVGDGITTECRIVPVRDIESSGQGDGKHKNTGQNFGHCFIFFLNFCIIVLTFLC